MQGIRHVAILITALSLSAASLFAQGKMKQQAGTEEWMKLEKELGLQTTYSVDMEVQAMGMAILSKTYRLAGKTRSETTMPFMNLRMVALQLTENGKPVSYTLFPDKKKYCINEDDADEAGDDAKSAYTIKEAGTEVFEGVSCKKRLLTMKTADGKAQEMDMLFSPAQKNMPVKMTATVTVEAEQGQQPMTITSVVLFKNYNFAAPAASLFTIPKDYVKAASMNEIMMGSLGGFAAPQQPAATQAGAAPAAGQPDLNALIRQAQQEAAREEAAEDKAADAPGKGANDDLKKGLQGLQRLFGK